MIYHVWYHTISQKDQIKCPVQICAISIHHFQTSRHAVPLRPLRCSGTERGGRQRCSMEMENGVGKPLKKTIKVKIGEGHVQIYISSYIIITDYICCLIMFNQYHTLKGFPVIQLMSHQLSWQTLNPGAEDIYETVQRWHSKECLGSNPWADRYMLPADHVKINEDGTNVCHGP